MSAKTAEEGSPLRIGVLGAGSWGTALADLLAVKGHRVDLWAREPDVVHQVNHERENRLFLPGFRLAEALRASGDLSAVASGKDLLLVVIPSHALRQTVRALSGAIEPQTDVVSAAKGIETDTLCTLSQVLRQALGLGPERIGVLSGPSFAVEVARRFPTAVAVASQNPDLARRVQIAFAAPFFRVYTSDDVIGVELGGAVKNVIAIAAGMIDGLGMGLNTRAALITRGMTEIRRLGKRLGANPRTFTGLAGYGDLILTCTGELSRNHTLGRRIAEGRKLSELLAETRSVAEGVHTARAVHQLSEKLGVEMPICRQVYRILYEDLPPPVALAELMTRNLKPELDEE
ncbi:MAG: NAD(P)H-dependent glycerol-3-phosphate dehydrogenase [Desulfobacterales bacterium]